MSPIRIFLVVIAMKQLGQPERPEPPDLPGPLVFFNSFRYQKTEYFRQFSDSHCCRCDCSKNDYDDERSSRKPYLVDRNSRMADLPTPSTAYAAPAISPFNFSFAKSIAAYGVASGLVAAAAIVTAG
ncbi:hypothetical protein SAMN02799630_00710 [Paenibacillus sp. UNCCL117]|uniref:hypothetical protein n=1 Tax=unclassified Paenibacillus TaxID=185978 RepID=UPI000890449C|nr:MULTISPECIES: hypothetical protein [unclassified Paenibacillus]SDC17066.1 hypothetical protein SAMN04488602_101509 [Paenibacillus sp. cl123]SFW17934.1 hypothetical protein SAMN02799630_00710 [Paenibacillus sp. UNCCL117]